MGYGPVDQNRFGWCWRNDHGSGKRMTPYFSTEELADAFHDYANSRKGELGSSLPDEAQIMFNTLMASFSGFIENRFDLRTTKLSEINVMAQEFAVKEKVEVISEPIGETMREFYGIDQESAVGYVDPSPLYGDPKSESKKRMRTKS